MSHRRSIHASRCTRRARVILVILLSVGCTALAQARDLFVSSRNTNSIKRYDAETGEYLGDFVAPGSGGLVAPQEVLFKDDGHLLVTGRNNTSILEYDGTTGEYRGEFSSGFTLRGPTKLTRGPDGYLYVSQWDNTEDKVVRFDATTGDFVDEFTSTSVDNGCGHAWDGDGNLYVASYGAKNVQKFGPDGQFIAVVASTGLGGPVNVWFDAQGDLMVLDWMRGAVVRFDPETGANKGDFITGLTNAEGLLLRDNGNILICDWTRNLINEYDASGTFTRVFTNQGSMLAPNSIALEPDSATPVRESSWGIQKLLFR